MTRVFREPEWEPTHSRSHRLRIWRLFVESMITPLGPQHVKGRPQQFGQIALELEAVPLLHPVREARRVHDNQVVVTFLASGPAEEIEGGVAEEQVVLQVDTVEREVALAPLEAALGDVHAGGRCRPARRSGQREAARVGEQVEHVAAPRHLPHARAVLPLIQEQTHGISVVRGG